MKGIPVYCLLSVILLTGCVRRVYMPVESLHTEFRDRYVRDSIYVHDSIYIYGKNDTVWLEKYRTVYRDRILTDSVFIQDTIRIPYPVEKIVYKHTTGKFQQIWIGLGIIWFIFVLKKIGWKRLFF